MRYMMFALVAVAGLIDIGSARAAWTVAPPGSEKSKEIASENIMDRPNRPLHIYGTWVRFTHRKESTSRN